MTIQAGQPKFVLVVDDEPQMVTFLESVLRGAGYRTTSATDGVAALTHIAAHPPDLVVLDLDMPGLNGFEVCRRIKHSPLTRLVPVLILTGDDPTTARLQAWDCEADAFMSKPFRPLEVVARCRSLLRHKELVERLDPAESVVLALARALEAKSLYTHGHSERVTAYALRLGERAGLAEAELDTIRRGGPLHDLGKICLPDNLLNKPERLTIAEYEEVKRHPAEGARILEPLRSLREVIPLIRWHHERMDGRGYPDGLGGNDIPLVVRVLSVADVFDALASARPYRAALSPTRCLEVLDEEAATGGLDPDLVQAFHETVTSPAAPALELTAQELANQ